MYIFIVSNETEMTVTLFRESDDTRLVFTVLIGR